MKNEKPGGGDVAAIIMKSVLTILLLCALLLTGSGCGGEKQQVGDPVDAYLTVIKSLEPPEEFQNEDDMKYIAVDSRRMAGVLDKKEKKRLLSELSELYEVEILDKNQVQLARGGYLEDNSFNDGILLQLKEADYITYEESPVIIEVMEWGRGTETMLRQQFTLEAEDGGWTITDISDVTVKKIT